MKNIKFCKVSFQNIRIYVVKLSIYFEILRFEEIHFDKISGTLVNNVNIESIMIIYKNYTPCMAVHVIE